MSNTRTLNEFDCVTCLTAALLVKGLWARDFHRRRTDRASDFAHDGSAATSCQIVTQRLLNTGRDAGMASIAQLFDLWSELDWRCLEFGRHGKSLYFPLRRILNHRGRDWLGWWGKAPS